MKIKGSVSVFVAMIFLLVISVITTTIISARVHGAGVMVNTSVSGSVDSIFAGYDSELFEKFGVLLFDGSYGGTKIDKSKISADIEKYMECNIGKKEGTDLYGIDIKGVGITNVDTAVSAGGLLWMDEAVDYEKYAKPLNLVSDYFDIGNIEDKTEQIINILEAAGSVGDSAEVINDKFYLLAEYIDGWKIKNNKVEGRKDMYLRSLKNPINSFEELKEIIKSGNYEYADAKIVSFLEIRDDLLKITEKAAEAIVVIDYHGTCIESDSEKIMTNVDEMRDIFGDDAVDAFTGDFEKMTNYEDVLKESICDIAQLKLTLMKNKSILTEAGNILVENRTVEGIDDVIELFKEYSYDGYDIDYSRLVHPKKKSRLIKTIIKLFKKGILGLVLPSGDDVSLKSIEYNNLASDSAMSDETYLYGCSTATKIAKKTIYGEYVMDNFSSYTDKNNEGTLNYEVEYIINGKSMDIDNLYSTVKKIALMRSALNMAYIITDSDKKNSAEEAARIALSWTNMEPLIIGGKYLILYGWSYAEALTDIKALLSGWKVSPIKNAEKWQTEFSDFMSLNIEPDEDKYKDGLDYEAYLRILLLSKDLSTLSLHTMDLVELWKISKGETDFRLKNYVYALKGEVIYTVGGSSKEYVYKFGQTY